MDLSSDCLGTVAVAKMDCRRLKDSLVRPRSFGRYGILTSKLENVFLLFVTDGEIK